MAKRKESVLGWPSVALGAGLNLNGRPIAYVPDRARNQEEQRILDKCHEQLLVMDGTKAKALVADHHITEIALHAVPIYDEAVAQIQEVDKQAKGKDQEPYTEKFCDLMSHTLAKHLAGVAEVSAASIAMEVHRSLYPEPEPVVEKPLSLWEKIFG